MNEMWKAWEGRTVDGKFPLQAYLGGSDHSAVFLTEMQVSDAGESMRAAIKLIAAGSADTQKQSLKWRAISDLSQPNLIRILDCGTSEIDGTAVLYVVEEYAEENLSQIIPERALTAEEAQGMLPPILETLQVLHDKGFVHGSIRPSNILAVGDMVKLSSDGLRYSGEKRSAKDVGAYDPPEAAGGTISKASDVWQLGVTLIEVLTQRTPSRTPDVPETMAEPFRDISKHCLQEDEAKRWSVSEILTRLRADRAKPAPMLVKTHVPALAIPDSNQGKPSRGWSYLLGLAVLTAVAFMLIPRSKPAGPAIPVRPSKTEGSQTTVPKEAKPSAAAAGSAKSDGSAITASEEGVAGADAGGVIHRALPEVSPSARRTIHGTIQVRVKVDVDASGNVTKAKEESGRVSKYFTRLAMEAARDWKFSPATAGDRSGDREWQLQFRFSRAKTEASAKRVTR
jgi:TonB family protein